LTWFGFVCFANKTKIVSSHTADSKPVKQEVNGTPLLVFYGYGLGLKYLQVLLPMAFALYIFTSKIDVGEVGGGSNRGRFYWKK